MLNLFTKFTVLFVRSPKLAVCFARRPTHNLSVLFSSLAQREIDKVGIFV
ncbi:MAG: hypothetical protein U7127_01620 [Phormidium sp.]